MKEEHRGPSECARRPKILHALAGGGKVMVLGSSVPAGEGEGAVGLPVHEPVPPRTTGIVRART
jgi:hypothetical protein